mgnify:CR=1 FL=1
MNFQNFQIQIIKLSKSKLKTFDSKFFLKKSIPILELSSPKFKTFNSKFQNFQL